MNEILKHGKRNEKGLSSLWILGSYFINMGDMEVGGRERGKKATCVILCSTKKVHFFFLFCESLQIKLSSENILIELGWIKDGSLSSYNYMV